MYKYITVLVSAVLCCLTRMASAGIPASLYVQDGLIAHWDALDNAGYCVHDTSATEWKNLVADSTAGDLPLAPLNSASWGENSLKLNSGGAKSQKQLITPGALNLGGAFTFEVMANSASGIIRRWEREPFATDFESWGSATEGYLERINGTRFTAQKTLLKNVNLGFTTTYDGARHAQIVRLPDGSTVANSQANSQAKSGFTYSGQMAFLSDISSGYGYSVRVYAKVLSEQERALNSALDQIRFDGRARDSVVLPNGWKMDADYNLTDAQGTLLLASGVKSYVWTGSAGTGRWADAANWTDAQGAAVTAAPDSVSRVTIGDGFTVTVDATANLLSLDIGSGSKVVVTEGAELLIGETATADGTAVTRVILSGAAASGAAADWVEGPGVVRIAGCGNASYPSLYRQPEADGWYEFGLKSGYSMGEKTINKTTRPFVKAEKVSWFDYGLPKGAKVRLVGGVLMDTVPAGWFSEVSFSGLVQLTEYDRAAFADGRSLPVPSGATFRHSPGQWLFSEAENGWYSLAVSQSLTNDVAMSGGIYLVNGNGTHYSNQVLDGGLSGKGTIKLDNFSNHLTVNGDWGFSGSVTYNSDQGGSLRIYSPSVSGEVASVTMPNCTGTYATNSSYSAVALAYGPKPGAPTTLGELKIATLNGNASDKVWDTKGVHVRNGGVLIVWGGNTVRVGNLKNGIHVVGRGQDQYCSNGSINNITTFGTGNVTFDKISSGTVWGSTNVNLTVGTVASSATAFDYTYQKDAINMATLDITGTCPGGATVKATDLAMLPARLSGFAGTVNLTDADEKTYPVTLDLSNGTAGTYNRGGCAGSGALGSVPAAGTIAVTLSGADAPVRGAYGIARFSSGGEKLDGWTVTIDGEAKTAFSIGSGENMKTARLMRDATGIWLKVSNPGLSVILK